MSRLRSSLWNRMTLGFSLLALGATLIVTRWGFNVPTERASSPSARSAKATAAGQRLIFAAGVVEGTSEPLDVRFEVSGRIRDVLVSEGQRVRKDEVLAELEPKGFELRVRMAEAAVRTVKLQSELVENGHGYAAEGASSTNSGNIPAATRQVSATHAGRTTEQLIASSRIEAAELALQQEQLQLEKSRLQAPMEGTIVECTVEPGELVGPHDTSGAFRIVDRTKTHVRAWIEELDAMDVRPGLSAVVVASGSVERKYRGYVISCASYVQPKSERHLNPGERVDVRVRELVIELKDGHDLLLGLPVEVFIAPGRDGHKETRSERQSSARDEE